jgi:ATP/maltotriose-dependent transcriptional regulator MalT
VQWADRLSRYALRSLISRLAGQPVVWVLASRSSAAKALGISVNTVGTHLRSAYAKLGVQSRVQLTNSLRERGELN